MPKGVYEHKRTITAFPLPEKKRCYGCNLFKKLDQFGKDRSRRDLLCAYCRDCARAKSREYNRNHYDPIREKKYYLKRKLEGRSRESIIRQIEKHPEKYQARIRYRTAVKKGEIVKPVMCERYNPHPEIPCFGPIQGHHYLGYDGEHWKDVIWLCRKHHMLEHRKPGLSELRQKMASKSL